MNYVGLRTHQVIHRNRVSAARQQWRRRGRRADRIAHWILGVVVAVFVAAHADRVTGLDVVPAVIAWLRGLL